VIWELALEIKSLARVTYNVTLFCCMKLKVSFMENHYED
jgi:hypothetical protein